MDKKEINILAVDDEPANLNLIELSFKGYDSITIIKAYNGKEALDILGINKDIDVILLDVAMPVMDGLETLEILKSNEEFKNIPVIIVTGNYEDRLKALKSGANDFIEKPYSIDELKLRTLNNAQVKKYNDLLKNMNHILEEKVNQRTIELKTALRFAKESELEISVRLGKAAEFRDIETGMHIVRMSLYSQKLAEIIGLSNNDCEIIRYASPLHDIGKIGIPDKILLKPGKLTEEEFQIMKLHTTIGGKMLDESDKYPVIKAGQVIALTHHEKWDGTGYPNELKGENIHIHGRIVAVSDVFDALTSRRIYKPAFSLEKALTIMKEGRAKHFDPDILDVFTEHINQFTDIKERFCDNKEESPLVTLLDEIQKIPY